MVMYVHICLIILFPVVQHRIADAVPSGDIHGDMEVALDQVQEMAAELDAQVAADAARDVENAF